MKKKVAIIPIFFVVSSFIWISVSIQSSGVLYYEKLTPLFSQNKSYKYIFPSDTEKSSLSYTAKDYIGLSNEVWDEDLTGEGVTVVVMDTGIYANHSVFTDNGSLNWDERIIAFYDEKVDGLSDTPYDAQWHGTWTASILGGNSSDYQGVAPDVKFVISKVFEMEKNVLMTEVSKVEDAVDWIIKNKEKYDIRIVSMSFGAKPEMDPDDYNMDEINELNELADKLVQEDLLVVAAAGNYGDEPGTVTAPGSSKSVLTVGGVDYDGEIFEDGGRGPTHEGAIKPDVCAPAVDVEGAKADITPNNFASHTGTSAATPFVSGLAALMLEKDSDLSALELKSIISLTSLRTIEPRIIKDNTQGWGIIQGYAALNALEKPIQINQNFELKFSLDRDYGVYCQPITLKPNHYFFELNQLDSAEAEIYLFNSKPDKNGNPILLSHTINDFSAIQRMGFFTFSTQNFYLVIKLIGNDEGNFKINLVFEFRLGIIIALSSIGIFSMVYIILQTSNLKKKRL